MNAASTPYEPTADPVPKATTARHTEAPPGQDQNKLTGIVARPVNGLFRTGVSARPDRWPVAVHDLGLVLVPGRGRPVRVQDQGPAPAVDHDLVVVTAQEDAPGEAGGAAVSYVLDMVHLARRGGLVAAARPPAPPVPRPRSAGMARAGRPSPLPGRAATPDLFPSANFDWED